MPQAADGPAKHGRSLLGFYIALGVAAVLLVLGTLLYTPLRLRYAIYTLDRSPAAPRMSLMPDTTWWREFDLCVKAARGGNEPAMAAVFRAVQRSSYNLPDMEEALGVLAGSQPELFYRLLAREDRGFILEVLDAILVRCNRVANPLIVIFEPRAPSPPGASADEEFRLDIRHMVEVLDKRTQSSSDEARGLARAALDFARQRFARELAEAEKVKPEVPKP